MLNDCDLVWNRACLVTPTDDRELRAGDRALAAVILAHGLVMNGGLRHALQGMSPSERRDAAGGFRFFALPELAELFELVVPDDDADDDDDLDPELDDLEEELNMRYWAQAPDDDALQRAFRKRFDEAPQAFAAVR